MMENWLIGIYILDDYSLYIYANEDDTENDRAVIFC